MKFFAGALILNLYCEFIIVNKKVLKMREPVEMTIWAVEIVAQFYSSGSMKPLKATKPIYASSGKESNTIDVQVPLSGGAIAVSLAMFPILNIWKIISEIRNISCCYSQL